MLGSILGLLACAANGFTEGHHWGRRNFLTRTGVDYYHVCTGITLWGFIMAAYFGLNLWEFLGVLLFGTQGLREWAMNWAEEKKVFQLPSPLRFLKFEFKFWSKAWFQIPVLVTGATLLILSWIGVI